jgi:hypothetical protein
MLEPIHIIHTISTAEPLTKNAFYLCPLGSITTGRELFKKFNIFILACEACKFLLSLLLFVVENVEFLQTNSVGRNISTRPIKLSSVKQSQ